MITVGTELESDPWEGGWRSVNTAGTDVDLRRARLLAQVLEVCDYKTTAGTTTVPGRSANDTSGWTEAE